MTEQQLRAAVAEYDAEMAREMVWCGGTLDGRKWFVSDHSAVRLDLGSCSISALVTTSHAATMRAMDAAAKAFQEALRCDNARGGK